MNETQSHALDREGPLPPPMCDAWLDEEKLAELFDDLAAYTEILSCQVKARNCVQVSETGVVLELAGELLISGQARGMQVRYRFQGHEWCDTIMRVNGKYRLVRCQYTS